ncbi:NfeD family protein [Wenzhouxiangella marina]|uniref:Nodulation efficiency protein D (NfeD) family protein n=1 Tax=Wenzhouxiangella marina TaxID=1579979 RepID=A0A0K0XZY1_9GAMM|nr:NfeD family protein [Wenzhouxiangella marina]AKS43239.1 Nodulation efficiency protein D (NfeD) family protein [Wenzhouxiangella marina]MBB6087074.1 membrane protein implicated in regulation of membrane protease activity [Wenzhouxiangella marina]
MVEQSWFWLILGALLILSEFFLTGIIAVFFGVGALLVGILTAFGLLNELPEQIVVFAVLSVGALLFARDRIKVWFRGKVSDRWDGDKDLIASRGERVTVTRAFNDGVGQVRLSGVEWKAESEDGDHAEGATVWVIGHRGITLQVSAQRPTAEPPADD